MKMNKLVINAALTATALFTMSGCSALQETMASQMEVPTLENQANRVAVGMTIVRENNIMAFKLPISADAKWPAMVTAEITPQEKQFMTNVLMDDPYFSTVHYTKAVQRKMLGSGAAMSALGSYGNLAAQVLDQTVSPLTYRAVKKLDIFYKNPNLKAKSAYGSDERYYQAVKQNWPNVYEYDTSLDSFLDFKSGKMADIDSPTGDIFDTIGAGVISLTPTSLQKDLEEARITMLEGYENVASLNSQKGQLETDIESDKTSEADKMSKSEELGTVEVQLKEAESIADEREAIYFNLLDQAVVALESDLNLGEENYVNLAKNINIVANEIQSSSTEAYTAFALAVANIAASNILGKFPKELESLAVAKASVPANLQTKYNIRMKRLAANALYLLPNAFIGTYYAHKQSVLAEKYENITNTILVAAEVQAEQNKAAAEEAKAAEQK